MIVAEASASESVGGSTSVVFVVVSLLTWWLHRIPAAKYAQAWKVSGKTLLSAAVVLFWAVPMVQLLINSGGGGQGGSGGGGGRYS